MTSLSSNDTFRHDAEEYVSNIAKGMHDPEWLRQAWAAHQRRAMGDYDEFYIRKVEVDWSTDIPDDHRPEHLRSNKSGTASAAGDRDNVSMEEAPKLGASVETSVHDGASDNGTMKQNGLIEKTSTKPTNGSEADKPDREIPNGSTDVADSITVHSEEPPESNGGPRFELIPSPAESGVESSPDRKGATNGAVIKVTQEPQIEAKVNPGSNQSEINASSGEVTITGEAMEVDAVEVGGSR